MNEIINLGELDPLEIITGFETMRSSNLWPRISDHLRAKIQIEPAPISSGHKRIWDDAHKCLIFEALEHFEQKQYSYSKEKFLKIIEFDQLCEAGFLGLSLSHFARAEFSHAMRLCQQAAIIDETLANGEHAEIYREMADAIGPVEAEYLGVVKDN